MWQQRRTLRCEVAIDRASPTSSCLWRRAGQTSQVMGRRRSCLATAGPTRLVLRWGPSCAEGGAEDSRPVSRYVTTAAAMKHQFAIEICGFKPGMGKLRPGATCGLLSFVIHPAELEEIILLIVKSLLLLPLPLPHMSTLRTTVSRTHPLTSLTRQVPCWLRPRDRTRSPEVLNNVSRPTTLPLRIPPRISITQADADRFPHCHSGCAFPVPVSPP